MKCEFCSEQCNGLTELCNHITSKHSELFPNKIDRGNCCDICYTSFESKENKMKHTVENHSTDSFYEKLVADISGVCYLCKMTISPLEMEKHLKTVHSAPVIKVSNINDTEVIEIKDDIKSNVTKPKLNSKNTKCDNCDFRSISVRSLELHKNKSHTPLLNCEQCDKKFSKIAMLKHHKSNSHEQENKCNSGEFHAKSLKFLNLHKAAKHLNIPLVKGMGIKRDASIKSQKSEKKVKLSQSPNKVDKKEEVITESSDDEELPFAEPKPWSEIPWVNSDKVPMGLSIKG